MKNILNEADLGRGYETGEKNILSSTRVPFNSTYNSQVTQK